MPLLPIDLQTMFNQMSQVGRETAVHREVSTQYQFLQGTEIVRKTEQDDRTVRQSRELGEGPEKVKEQRQRQGRGQAKPKGEDQASESQDDQEKGLFDDPDLGHHVDLVG
ncbi:MAG: hypothetical protein JW820_01750 [Spirochaetales bacterium]|nr:hypothetical protein [Spirochaetales bacterium]